MRTLAVLILPGAPVFEVAIPCQVFGTPPPGHEDPWYKLLLCADGGPGPVPLRGSSGHTDLPGLFQMSAAHGLDALEHADTVIVPACSDVRADAAPAAVAAVRAAHARGARIVSLCSGAFLLAAAGLLDGRRSASHWKHAPILAARYPAVDVDPAVLYIDHGDVVTGAGNTAGIDLCLHLIRQDLGTETANAVARHLVVPPHRTGGQAQYVESPLPATGRDDGLGPLLQWAVERLDEPLTIADLAARAGLAGRTLIRRFHAETGTTPLRWLLAQRLIRARELLERTDLPVDQVAERCGLGSAANLRAHFARELGVPPSEYRRNHRPAVP
ncbi:GlxA family transcriptional regulator [Actinomadura rayongensis]|uniref:Helix-turn-helix domain-containing protein n=1 Tax=Actinomadura rayongensis TaxID=1429076 RepID=A0A6I4WCK9_9ACTN|nr:helix-turn-helix domain-containing protein [Actinomadura rayongensis]MXQ67937.1 helix-turn-helix domain-containing protein [Actinomadura rayongensis]